MVPPTLLRAGRKLVSPSQHLWIRARDTFMCSKSGEKTHVLEMGLTHRGVEDIGDVQSISLLQPDSQVRKGQDLLRVSWEGHAITAADELYHTVWETVEGFTMIQSPMTGVVQETDTPWIDADDSLLSMTATEKSLFTAFSHLVCEDSYNKIIQNMPPGRFAESMQQQREVSAIA